MGKNLLCVHSKKHMDDDPALKPAKMKRNLNTVKAMGKLLKGGGLCMWIAPAGGRDRRGPDGGIVPDKFDPAAVEMMRKLGTKKTAASLLMVALDVRHHAPAGCQGEGGGRGANRQLHRRGALPGRGDRRGSRHGGVGRGSRRMRISPGARRIVWEKVNEEYKAIEACNVPGGGDVPLPSNPPSDAG